MSTTINDAMLVAAARAIAAIARMPVPEEIERRYGRQLTFGKEYIIPKMGDPRLLTEVTAAVARSAMESGVARRSIASFGEYRDSLKARVDNTLFFNSEKMRHRSRTRNHNGCENRLCKM